MLGIYLYDGILGIMLIITSIIILSIYSHMLPAQNMTKYAIWFRIDRILLLKLPNIYKHLYNYIINNDIKALSILDAIVSK